MRVVVEHDVTDPKAFWDAVNKGMGTIPAGLTVQHVFPNPGGSRAVCVWNGPSVEAVREYVEGGTKHAAKNKYFEVDEKNAVGA